MLLGFVGVLKDCISSEEILDRASSYLQEQLAAKKVSYLPDVQLALSAPISGPPGLLIPIFKENGVTRTGWLIYQGAEAISPQLTPELQAAGHILQLALDNLALRRQTTTDALTGVNNRAYFEKRLKEELDKTRRYGQPFSLLMLDIDRFKSFNDNYGHQAGDEVLRIVGKALKDNTRSSDMVFRYGGEEFAVILLHVDEKTAVQVAERLKLHLDATINTADRLRRSIKMLPLVRDGQRIPISISVGVSAYAGAGAIGPAELIRAADESLYRAKHNGRDCLEVIGKQEKLRILVVDDDVEHSGLLAEFFLGRGYEVAVALSGEQAVDFLKREDFNIMLLDLRMPGMNGIDVLRMMPECVKRMRVMVLTGVHDQDMKKASYQLGASEFLNKPVSIEYLNNHVMARILEMRV